MTSKILYPGIRNNPPNEILISYCLEPTKDVLRKVFFFYMIYKYGDIQLPIDSELDERGEYEPNYGLIIKQAASPKGTQIVANLSGIDLTIANSELRITRNDETIQREFKRAIAESMHYFLDEWGTDGDYLLGYDLMEEEVKDPKYERRIEQLLEIAEVVLNIEHPKVSDLVNITKEKVFN